MIYLVNPLEFKHDITSRPLKELLKRPGDTWNDWYALSVLAVGLETAAVNLLPSIKLIDMGSKGYRFMDISYVTLKSGFRMPSMTWSHFPSQATKLGTKLGGKVGAAKLGGKIAGRFIPGVGWALLAYDAYDVLVNRSLWGFDLD